MNISEPFVRRPVATTLLTIALALAGILAYFNLPVAPLPQVDYPTINVSAGLPGASPETMASSVATPLERQFGRIAGLNEMTSTSTLGQTSITLQFDLSRDIDAAGRDVQAAINAARSQLPANLPSNPRYRKVNHAAAPILILSMTSQTYDRKAMYNVASSVLAQKLSQMPGVGEVFVGGGSLPAVRVNVDPALLNNLSLDLEDVRQVLSSANVNEPKGQLMGPKEVWSITASDQLMTAAKYKPLIVGWRHGAPVRLSDVASVTDSVEDVRTRGIVNGQEAVMLIIRPQPDANIIDTVDRILAVMPQMQADLPAGMNLNVVLDRSTTIRASVHDIDITLLISVILVILVVFAFLRDIRTTIIPGVAVPISLIGTFGVMYLLGYSLDNLSLMALTIATGFVVDDAIVVIENIMRHIEAGMDSFKATLLGSREIGFTVVSMSSSLIAVFLPILLMTGLVGRIFREFAVTLSIAVAMSMIVSLTVTPMMCAVLLKPKHAHQHGRIYRASEWWFDWILGFYETTLDWVLRHKFIMLLVTLATMGLSIYLYMVVPKGFLPQEDTGRMAGFVQADQNASFQSMRRLLDKYAAGVQADPAVDSVVAFTGGGGDSTVNTARMYISLKPLSQRRLSADQVAARLRKKLGKIPGATFTPQVVQDIRMGGRSTQAQYQYSLQGQSYEALTHWAPILMKKMRTLPGIVDIRTDQQNRGLQAQLVIDRDAASRFGITSRAIDNTLYDAFGQRQVSTMYTPLNQYHVIMEVAPKYWQNPSGLKSIYVKSTTGTEVPLSAFAHYESTTTSLAVNHQGQFPAITLSFNLLPGFPLGNAVAEINQAEADLHIPASIHGSFQGTAQAAQASWNNEVTLMIAALVAVYIVLGILYESYIHPITILSTIPSAGVGALLAILLCRMDLDLIALIGIILLIGIVKKNAIMMIDFALETERQGGKSSQQAIREACLLRFRPIMMTTMAALLGGVPLATGLGTGAELRQPLGITIVGGLIFSQMLTLYTTPVIYLYLDRLRLWFNRIRYGAPVTAEMAR